MCYHDPMVTHIAWIIQFVWLNRKKTCYHDSVWKIKLTSWLDNSTAVENRLVGKCNSGLVEKHIRSAYIQPLGGAKYSSHIGSLFSTGVYRLVRLLTAVETHLFEKPRIHIVYTHIRFGYIRLVIYNLWINQFELFSNII